MKCDQSLQLLEEVNESCNNNNQDGKEWFNVASIQANERRVGLFLGKALDARFALAALFLFFKRRETESANSSGESVDFREEETAVLCTYVFVKLLLRGEKGGGVAKLTLERPQGLSILRKIYRFEDFTHFIHSMAVSDMIFSL